MPFYDDDSFEDESNTLLSHINVTPLVDVTLVLLIIFMITAPLMQHGLKIDLPKAQAKELKTSETSLILTITKDRKLQIGEFDLKLNNLSEKIKAIYENKHNKDIFIKADKKVNYGFVITVMAALKKAGLDRIGLVTLPK